jgi:D-hexose-6-phosphate mutarotase
MRHDDAIMAQNELAKKNIAHQEPRRQTNFRMMYQDKWANAEITDPGLKAYNRVRTMHSADVPQHLLWEPINRLTLELQSLEENVA